MTIISNSVQMPILNPLKVLQYLTMIMTTVSRHPRSSREATCGARAQRACVFPFTAWGRVFATCTTYDGDTRPWCATRVDEVSVT